MKYGMISRKILVIYISAFKIWKILSIWSIIFLLMMDHVVLTQMATWNWSNANAVLRYVRDKAIFACASNTDSIWRPILIEMFHWLSCISGTLNWINLHSRYLKLNHQLYCIMKLRYKIVIFIRRMENICCLISIEKEALSCFQNVYVWFERMNV